MSRDRSEALHARARAFVDAFERGAAMPEPFDRLAVDLARFQARFVPGYARLCAHRGLDPASFERAADAPAVPTDAFKLTDVFAFPATDARATFRTSGTTLGSRGTHRMRDVATYDRAALASGRAMLAHDVPLPAPVLVIGPSEVEASDSSLAHMDALFVNAWAPEGVSVEETYFVRGSELEVGGLRARVERLPASSPAIVLTTSFALVHLLDALGGARLPLPPGSRVMLTGGYKGRSREVEATQLRWAVAETFAVAERCIVGEYGMTELSSQFWEATVRERDARRGVYVEPP